MIELVERLGVPIVVLMFCGWYIKYLQENFMNVFKKAQPSVVYIRTNVVIQPRNFFEYYRQVEGAGAGFVIDKEGYIVTNNHVVAGARRIEVIFSDSRTMQATL